MSRFFVSRFLAEPLINKRVCFLICREKDLLVGATLEYQRMTNAFHILHCGSFETRFLQVTSDHTGNIREVG